MGIKIDFHLLKVGETRHLKGVAMKGGGFRTISFPAIVALLKHPGLGWILFDTGYSDRFFSASRKFPERLHRWATPVFFNAEKSLPNQLQTLGINQSEIKLILLSHLHADHIGSLRDFPGARVFVSKKELVKRSNESRWRATIHGFLADLMPDPDTRDFQYYEDFSICNTSSFDVTPFEQGIDLFADGSILAISLPGHSPGHTGILFQTTDDQTVFLVGDTCWTKEALIKNRLPAFPANLILDDRDSYKQTFSDLRSLLNRRPDINVIPTHCEKTWQDYLIKI